MNRRAMSYKPPVPPQARPKSRAQPRQPKPKPEWIEDFNDTSAKYRVSQMELIKRKAQRQSSNRQIAKQELAERMRKLEKGIIDNDTRKVYEEALISKGIDINPPLRRNLSQMIQYEKQIQQQSRQVESYDNIQDQVTKELKNTQEFIKRMEKASKARDITHAIEILQVPASSKWNHSKSSNMLNVKQQLSPLSNIQGTMNFLQNLLKPKQQQTNESLTLQLPNLSQNIHQSLESFSKQIIAGAYHTQRLQQDLNHVSFVQKKNQTPTPHRQIYEAEDDEWSNTINRMHNMLETKSKELQKNMQWMQSDDPISLSKQFYKYSESKEQAYGFNSSSSIKQEMPYMMKSHKIQTSSFKQNTDRSNLPYSPRGGQQIQFSLTMNNSQLKLDTDQFFDQPEQQPEQYTKSYLNLQSNKGFSKKPKFQQLIQQQQPDTDNYKLIMPSKKVTFSNQVMSKAIGDTSETFIRKQPSVQQPKITSKNNKQAEIRRLLEEAQNGMGRIAPERFDITSSVNIKKQLR